MEFNLAKTPEKQIESIEPDERESSEQD